MHCECQLSALIAHWEASLWFTPPMHWSIDFTRKWKPKLGLKVRHCRLNKSTILYLQEKGNQNDFTLRGNFKIQSFLCFKIQNYFLVCWVSSIKLSILNVVLKCICSSCLYLGVLLLCTLTNFWNSPVICCCISSTFDWKLEQ